ncbi:MAG: TonB-dependent receptor [Opitutales bacterium]
MNTDTPQSRSRSGVSTYASASLSAKKWLTIGLSSFLTAGAVGSLMAQEEEVLELEGFESNVRGESRATNALDISALNTVLPGTSPEKMLDKIPGVNVVTRDPFGFYEFGNDVRVRAFNLQNIGVTLDGMPNGNNSARYGTPIGRMLDTDNLATIKVSQGAGDVATPAYQALGGSLQYFSVDPEKEMGATLKAAYGSFDYQRMFGKFETGEIIPGLTAYVSGSLFEFKTRGLERVNAVSDREHYDFKTKYELPNGNGSISFSYAYNNRNDFDTLGLDWAEYRGLETGQVPEGYESDTSVVAFTAGGYREYTPFNDPGLGSFDYGDLSDQGRNYGPPTYIDPSVDPGAGVNANYYNLWRNGRRDNIYRFNIDYDFTDEISLSVVPYYHDKNSYGLFGRSNSFASSQVRSAFFADPDRTDITGGSVTFDPGTGTYWNSGAEEFTGTWFDADGNAIAFPDPSGFDLTTVAGTEAYQDAFDDAFGSIAVDGIPGRTGRDEEFGGFRYGITSSLTWETDNNKLVVGGWYEYDRHITERPNYNLQNGGSVVGWFEYDQFNFLNYSRYIKQYTYQGWIQDTYTTLDGALDIIGGIKMLKLDRDADGFLTVTEWINNTPTARSTSYEDTFLPQFGLVYRINDELEAFFNYSENLSVPTAGTITTAGDTFDPNLLAPEYSENFDIGFRGEYEDVSFTFQAYMLEYTDRILSSPVPLTTAGESAAGNSRFVNVGGVDSWGAEASVDWTTPVEGLTLTASLAIQESTFAEDLRSDVFYQDAAAALPSETDALRFVDNGVVDAPGSLIDGQREVLEFTKIGDKDLGNTPFLTANFDATYVYDAWTFGFSGKFYDDVYVNTLNTQPLDSYTTFDASVAYKGKEGTALEGWKATLAATNVFDQYYWLARSYNDEDGQVLADRGRVITFTVTAEF